MIDPGADDLTAATDPDGSFPSYAREINRTGQVVGWDVRSSSGDVITAFRTGPLSPIDWTRDELNGRLDFNCAAYGINDHGVVVGEMGMGPCWPYVMFVPFRTAANTPIVCAFSTDRCADDLNRDWPCAGGAATAIDNLGRTVGIVYPNFRDKSVGQAFRTEPNQPIDPKQNLLGTLGGSLSSALDINLAGKVVGWADTASGARHAFIWEAPHGMLDLNDLIPPRSGWTLTHANGINEFGQIVGSGLHDGQERAFRLDPVLAWLMGLEVTQVSQDWQNRVPLAADKHTWVRAHFQAKGAQNNVEVSARLHGTDDSGRDLSPAYCDAEPPGRVVARSGGTSLDVRAKLDQTLNFRLPLAWCRGSVVLSLETPAGDPFPACAEAAEPTGTPGDGRVALTFQPAAGLEIAFVPVSFVDPVTGARHEVDDTDIAELVNRLRAVYPLPASWGLHQGARIEPAIEWTDLVPLATGGTVKVDGHEFRALINGKLKLMNSYAPGIYYGVYLGPPWGGSGPAPGHAEPPVASGSFSRNAWVFTRNQHAHELGHVLGLPHTSDKTRRPCHCNPPDPPCPECQLGPCGEESEVDPATGNPVEFPHYYATPTGLRAVIGPLDQGDDAVVFGFDTSTTPPTIHDPRRHFELMSYCGQFDGTPEWASAETYTRVWNALLGGAHAASAASAVALAGASQTYLLVRGTIDPLADTATLLPFTSITTTTPPPLPPPGDYGLQLLDRAGQVLGQVSFQLDRGSERVGPSLSSFVIPVPAHPGLDRVVVLHQTTVLASRGSSARPPTLSLLYPVGGETLADDRVLLQWTASDADGDPLTYLVLYSPDAGGTWRPLAADLTQTRYTLDTEVLQATARGRIRILATDGFHTTTAESAGDFLVPNRAPIVTISRPAEGQIFSGDQLVGLSADARDPEDGFLSGSNVKWFSSQQGALGEGNDLVLPAAALAEGTHAITVTASDAAGAAHHATVTLRRVRGESPLLSIRSDRDQATIAWPATLTDWYLESSESLSATHWLSVTNEVVVSPQEHQASVCVAAEPGTRFFRLRRR